MVRGLCVDVAGAPQSADFRILTIDGPMPIRSVERTGEKEVFEIVTIHAQNPGILWIVLGERTNNRE